MYVAGTDFTFVEVVKLGLSTIRTRLFYPGAMIIRHPFFIRGRKKIHLGKGFACGYNCRLEVFSPRESSEPNIVFGDGCHIGDNVHIAAVESVTIGERCLFASHVFITDLSHGNYASLDFPQDRPDTDPNERPLTAKPVSIGNTVWIGEGVAILQGVSIGDGCIIGAHSVVTHDIPAGSMAVGSPARVIKQFNQETETWERV